MEGKLYSQTLSSGEILWSISLGSETLCRCPSKPKGLRASLFGTISIQPCDKGLYQCSMGEESPVPDNGRSNSGPRSVRHSSSESER